MDTTNAIVNPLLDYARDPWIVYYHNQYWLILASSDNRELTITCSSTLAGLRNANPTTIWRGQGAAAYELWAPELHLIDGRWYIYYAADNGDNANHRMYVLESVGDNPGGPYKDCGALEGMEDFWAIDGTILEHSNKKRYFLWSGWPTRKSEIQNLYIMQMDSPYSVIGSRVCIASPEFLWERQYGEKEIVFVVEGHAALVHDDKIFVTYSASHSVCDQYCLGLLTASLTDDPLNPDSWHKKQEPWLSPRKNAWGLGHNSFFRSPDQKELWIAYHANNLPNQSWRGATLRVQPITWNKNGEPNVATAVEIRKPIPGPSGECS